ncbi:hypothetical protein AN401_11685 [Zobellella denitrificans]|uniref:Phage virion morphogenesis protein n=1 Tax=Zobellella denitrificans TaxID=347534 RepID=A0A291HQK9_9GAMM|nr:phage virion morphogenesis protein [Zobellella denitrificans]ATG74433.1 hypothetical protein AN401_11685 [Zobellella denitrificans]
MRVDTRYEFEAVFRAFAQLQALQRQGRDLMRPIAGVLADRAEDAFADEADPETGRPWTALSQAHRRRRQRQGYDGPLLQMKGLLAGSLSTEYGDNHAVAGSAMIYATIHQFGGKAGMAPGPAAVPARPFLGIGNEGERAIARIIKKALSNALDAR